MEFANFDLVSSVVWNDLNVKDMDINPHNINAFLSVKLRKKVFLKSKWKHSNLCFLLWSLFVGGYEDFHSLYPECCIETKPTLNYPSLQEVAEPDANQPEKPCGNCRPAYDQVRAAIE